MANVSMRQMLEAGVHFGHQTRYWNPKMAPYIFGARGRIHIINLEKTLPLFNEAMDYLENTAANRGTVLFVGTKKAARKVVEEQAKKCNMPYVNFRWLGGMLTNFKTIKQSIARLKELESMQADGSMQRFSKKEGLGMTRELEKLENSLGGIKGMNKLPEVMFVLDVGYEKNAVNEAKKLGIPVVGIVDTNNEPNAVDYMIPGNDDSIRALQLYSQSASLSILEGRAKSLDVEVAEDEFIEMDEPDRSMDTELE
ncbi:MAG: 30S ribosomal protein S2 [Methylococcaceae bacterium]|nr:30S ribosomal protein S2 [Methylococcaceae bacterium]MCI0667473.1 30S ribosomal protein S2 [Methylococcaceae bacterium]MCI0732294.1 30S ribosomal protein S2 [Methylococcaceae bacterium]